MKINLYLAVFLSSCLILSACEKIDNEPETGGPDPLEDPILWLWPGQDTLLRVKFRFTRFSELLVL